MSNEELSSWLETKYKEAREQKPETVGEFIQELVKTPMDYNTSAYVCSIAAIAGASAANTGITVFQADCIMWEFVTRWMPDYRGRPLKLINYENMLYPQYYNKFQKWIGNDTWEWLQTEAKKKIAEDDFNCYKADTRVRSHWECIAEGMIPFGYIVCEE